ncbi:purine-cytosine permease family protein [Parendozoicomonas haliclonae]|uniref:Putative allantoin permease n=1 Tax=Parendozoicomonas haliclonae TaxID=1960125 RepID=A0A1X7AL75_9GAMM|nr:cytosine permease [Parendozoicomonas haliclonae]SMA48669.1 putative allantoin permease [Parendozoicomonas haliclonae]
MQKNNFTEIYLADRQGLMPVQATLRQGGFWPLFALFCNSMMNPATLVTSGLMIQTGLPLALVALVQTLGVCVGMWPFIIVARVGSQYGVPGQVFCRAVFGYQGSRWLTSLLRVITSVYWYAFQTLAAMMAVDAILGSLGFSIPLAWLGAGFVILQGGIALSGYAGLTVLSGLTLPLKLVIFIGLTIWLMLHVPDGGALPERVFAFQAGSWSWAIVLFWMNGLASSMMSLMTDAADFSRFTHQNRRFGFGVLAGVACGTALGALFGGWCIVAGGGNTINPFDVIVALNPGSPVLLMVLLVTVFDAWTINVINLYTGGFSLANAFPRLGRQTATLFIIAGATLLAFFPAIIDRYLETLSAVGVVYAATSGVLLGWCLRYGQSLDVDALYEQEGRYRYFRGWNLLAVGIFVFCMSVTSLIAPAWLPSIIALLGATGLMLIFSQSSQCLQSKGKN